MSAAFVAVDIGNTAVKVAWFGDERLSPHLLPVPTAQFELPAVGGDLQLDALPFASIAAAHPAAPWFVSSVNRSACDRLAAWRADALPSAPWRVLDYRVLPLTVDVDFPDRVGLDRLATSCAADWLRAPDRDAIVVDAGTALKIHVIRADGVFVGGAILPGLRLSSESLHVRTDLLPRVGVSTADQQPPVVGRNTEAAIRSGIYWGAVGAVREIVTRMRAECRSEPQVFITGGDAAGLAALIDHDTRFVPGLGLAGIAVAVHRLGLLDAAP